MLKNVACVGDSVKVLCDLHESPIEVGGTFYEGSPNFSIRGKSVVRIGDKATLSCGHEAELISGSDNLGINGKKIGRVGDTVKVVGGNGTGVVTSGTDTFLNS